MEYVWVKPEVEDIFELPYGACIIEKFRDRLKIRDDYGKAKFVPASDIIRTMHVSCVNDVDDMTKMGELEDYTILRNLELRYRKKLIYTYAGNVLIAVNPYESLPIYGKDVINQYRNKKLGMLPPHLFAIGDVSYDSMKFGGERQCIILNGESGAGKTESTKLLLQYYLAIGGKRSMVEERILESNSVLEAFGNARTIRNNNSSRFGKYIAIYFNWEGEMIRAEVRQFLLEKSRLVAQAKGERNYHVFYMMLKGLSNEEKTILGLKEVFCYKYLAEDGKNDQEETRAFREFRKALKCLDFSNSLIWQIFELLAVILHLGNIMYNDSVISGIETIEVIDSLEVNYISRILGVTNQCLKSCLTRKTIKTGSDRVIKLLNKQDAIDTRDNFVKAIYGNLFNFIIRKVNEAIRQRGVTTGYIGLLDIFGFENNESNSFEQLCINLTNESLQQFFIKHTFKLEQLQYIEDGIPWPGVNFVDNWGIIAMISGDPMSIFSIINDQCRIKSSTDEKLLEKLIEHHGENEFFFQPKFNNIQAFGVKHFAGVVIYEIKDFLEKNRDAYSWDCMNLVKLAENQLLRQIFADDFAIERTPTKKQTLKTSATKFKNSLDELMTELNGSRPFFVRCIRPNDKKMPGSFDRKSCCQQLRYSGIWETSRIRQIGFPIRYTYRDFINRYRMLKPGILPGYVMTQVQLQEAAREICVSVFQTNLNNQFGHTMVFLRSLQYCQLENMREKSISRYVITLQSACRGWILRKRFTQLRKSAMVAQKWWRGRSQRKLYQMQKLGFLRLQAVILGRFQRISYLQVHSVLLRFQARCKGFAVRRLFYRKLQKKKAENEEVKKLLLSAPEVPPRKVIPPVPTWKKLFRSKRSMGQKSFLHNPNRPDPIAEVSRFVDNSFRFLNEHHSPE